MSFSTQFRVSLSVITLTFRYQLAPDNLQLQQELSVAAVLGEKARKGEVKKGVIVWKFF